MDVERGSTSSGFPSPQKAEGAAHAHLASNLPPTHPHGVRGNAVPLGLLCFGMTTCMLMFVTTGWSPPGFNPAVLAYALFYGGLGQFIAGVLEFIKGNTFGGTAFCSYGAFWMGFFIWHYLEASKTVPAVALTALTGDSLWCGLWAILTAAFFVVSLRKNHGEIVVFSTLTLTFILLIGANYSTACKRAAGYVGMFCGSSAIYTGIAMLFRDELGLMLPGVAPVRYI